MRPSALAIIGSLTLLSLSVVPSQAVLLPSTYWCGGNVVWETTDCSLVSFPVYGPSPQEQAPLFQVAWSPDFTGHVHAEMRWQPATIQRPAVIDCDVLFGAPVSSCTAVSGAGYCAPPCAPPFRWIITSYVTSVLPLGITPFGEWSACTNARGPLSSSDFPRGGPGCSGLTGAPGISVLAPPLATNPNEAALALGWGGPLWPSCGTDGCVLDEALLVPPGPPATASTRGS